MKVTLFHAEVIEACREWIERHYGFEVKDMNTVYGVLNTNNAQTYELSKVAVEFRDVPKPEGGPYRTPAGDK